MYIAYVESYINILKGRALIKIHVHSLQKIVQSGLYLQQIREIIIQLKVYNVN